MILHPVCRNFNVELCPWSFHVKHWCTVPDEVPETPRPGVYGSCACFDVIATRRTDVATVDTWITAVKLAWSEQLTVNPYTPYVVVEIYQQRGTSDNLGTAITKDYTFAWWYYCWKSSSFPVLGWIGLPQNCYIGNVNKTRGSHLEIRTSV